MSGSFWYLPSIPLFIHKAAVDILDHNVTKSAVPIQGLSFA
jgi:hypothetical protein